MLPVYPVFEDEKSKASDEKLVKQKTAIQKTDRTNKIAANFVCKSKSQKICKKNYTFFQRNAKISDVKMLKPFHYL